MIRIEYNFRDDYPFESTIANELTDGETFTSTTDMVIENKRYIGISDIICTIDASYLAVTFKHCLFVRCGKIALSTLPIMRIEFEQCTIVDCNYIVDTTTVTGSGQIIFTSCIIYRNVFIYTALEILFRENRPSYYTDFYGASGDIIYNGSTFVVNPLFIDTLDYTLMSKSRGFAFTSPCASPRSYHDAGSGLVGTDIPGLAAGTYSLKIVNNESPMRRITANITPADSYDSIAALFTQSLQAVEPGYPEIIIEDGTLRAVCSTSGSDSYIVLGEGSSGDGTPLLAALGLTQNPPARGYDGGCWTERRSTFPQPAYDTLTIHTVPDVFSKKQVLTEYKQFLNENGDLIQLWNFGSEKKGYVLRWQQNGLTNQEMQSYLLMMQAKDDRIIIYPDNNDPSKYAVCQLMKQQETTYQKSPGRFFERNTMDKVPYKQISIAVVVDEEVGSWLP